MNLRWFLTKALWVYILFQQTDVDNNEFRRGGVRGDLVQIRRKCKIYNSST